MSMIIRNIAIWHDGTFRPAKGHHGDCVWVYDGQVFYHLKKVVSDESTK